jgi:hypothetical protein
MMQELMNYFNANPTALVIALVVCFGILYFIYRKLLSTIIVIVLIFLMTLLGYSYYRDTNSLDEAFKKTKIESQQFFERFSDIFRKAGEKTLETGKEIKKKVGE